MNNLTTRKIVLGLLMTLVLAFSVQGTADALTMDPTATIATNSVGTATGDLGSLNIGGTITIGGINDTLNNIRATESVYISVTSGRAYISQIGTVPTNNTSKTSHSWTESGNTNNADTNIGTNGDVDPDIPSSVTITTRTAGELTVTVSWTSADATSSTRDASESFTFYIVRPIWEVPRGTTLALRGLTNGVGQGYYDGNDQPIFNGSGDYQVTYAVTNVTGSGGGVYVKKGNRPITPSPAANLTTSSRAQVYLDIGSGTKTVTLNVVGTDGDAETKGLYVFQNPSLDVSTTTNTDQTGSPGTVITTPFTVTVTDGGTGGSRGVTGVPIKFDVRNKSATTGGTLIFDEASRTGDLIDDRNMDLTVTRQAGSTIYVRTGANGVANIAFQLGSASGDQFVDVSAVGFTRALKAATTVSDTTRTLSIHANQSRQGSPNVFDLIALVENGDQPEADVSVRFTTTRGLLTNTPRGTTDDPTADLETSKDVVDKTDTLGRAQVIYNAGDSSGAAEVVASISVIDDDRVIDLQEIIFNIRGGTGTGGNQQQNQQQQQQATNTITISPSSTTGDPGETETISVTSSPTGVLVTLSSNDFANTLFSPQSGLTPFTSTLTLPSSTGSYDFFAFGSINNATVQDSATVTVATTAPGTVTIEALGAPANGSQAVRVTVRESDGTLKSDALSVTLTGPGISRAVETVGGTGAAAVTVPTATTSYTLTASAAGYTSGSITLTTTGQTGGSTPPPAGPAGEADSVEIDGSRQLSGTVDQAMRLRVRVLDANDNGVSDVRVTFRVLAPGRGTFAGARGNGRAVPDQTDRNGYASASLTPSDDGDLIVRASAAGVSADVTFIIDVGEASTTTRTPTTPTSSTDVTPSSATVSPVVHVGAASRPPMLWVDGGAIYALVGADVKEFAPSVDNALNITVAGGKVYWTEKTGESGGTINSANLNGSGVTELTSIRAVPMGIAVDTAGSKLYWTNSRGRIQSANLDGSRITNELQDLPSPMDIALGNGNVYWTQGNGSVRVVNLTGQKIVRDISTGSDTPGSLVIGSGKVYWTEMTGDSSGTVNSANLNGTGATQLASIRAVPSGIAVDGARSKLYWTNSRGRVQSADLDGSGITNVVDGLGSPGDMVLSNSISAPAATPTTPTTPTASNAKYDVNSDGSVDNTDAGLVADALGTSNTRYDVNGDGSVNFLDLLLVFDNRDADAAGAPTIVGMKLSAVQIDIIEEQIDLLIATNDRSPAAMRTLVYLQQLLVTARPEKTQLLANYPNPFNPETWIPYELATDTNVRITIYNTQGVVIRSLQFGHQSAGYYTGRDRAAYWDGRNALGEQVASGLYFYQLETDEMSSMRKMVILK